MTLPGMNVPALRRHSRQCGIDVRGEMDLELISGGRSNLKFVASDEASRWVVRRPQLSGVTPSANAMARKVTVTDALQDSIAPVAKTVAFDAVEITLGAPVSVVEFKDRIVVRIRDNLVTFSDYQVGAAVDGLVEVLVDLHAVNPCAMDQDIWPPRLLFERQVKIRSAQWDRLHIRDVPYATSLYQALSGALLGRSSALIVHGDFLIGNAIVDPADPGPVLAVVVDEELSTVGDLSCDAAVMRAYRSPVFNLILGSPAAWSSSRLPTSDQIAHAYAPGAGRELHNWNFYIALATFELGVIGEGVAHRALRGSDAGSAAERAAEATPEFMAAGLRASKDDHR